MEVMVDIVNQTDSPSQQQHGANSAGAEALDSIRELVVNIARRHHRFITRRLRPICNAFEQPLPTLTQPSEVSFSRGFAIAFPPSWRKK